MIHRDVKPQNVIVPDQPRSARCAAKLTDFGVAHLAGDEPLTRTGDVVGTLAYMAPEQATGSRSDERADLYSLGARALRGPRRRQPGARRQRRGHRARASASRLPPLAAQAQGPPGRSSARRSTARSRPRPEDRGTLRRAGRRARRQRCPRSPTRAARSSPTRSSGPAPPPLPPAAGRVGAALAAAGLAAAPCAAAGGRPPAVPAVAAGPLAAAVAAALVVGAAAAGGLARAGDRGRRRCSPPTRPGFALVLAAAARRPAADRRGTGRAWSLPAAAPLLGLADARPAPTPRSPAARRARAPARRARRRRPVVARSWPSRCWTARCCSGPNRPRDWPRRRRRWRSTASLAPPFDDAASSPSPRCGPLAALILPWLVRGRHLGPDFVGASAWAAGLGAGTAAVAEWAGAPDPRGPRGAAPSWPGSLALAAAPRCCRGISWTHDRSATGTRTSELP